MGKAIGTIWAKMSDVWKGVTVLVAVATATVALTLQLVELQGLPGRVDENTASIDYNAAELDELQRQNNQQNYAIDQNRALANRILCYLEAAAEERSAVGCSR